MDTVVTSVSHHDTVYFMASSFVVQFENKTEGAAGRGRVSHNSQRVGWSVTGCLPSAMYFLSVCVQLVLAHRGRGVKKHNH